MPVITIDNKEYKVKQGDNLLQACLSLGLDLPYFCWHPDLGSIGSCRQCAVVQYQNSDDQRGRIVMGCMTPVTDGAIFSLNGDKAKGFRESVIESLMLNHPHDCPVCAEGGECHLQDMTVMVGHRDRQYKGLKNTHKNQYLGPLINHEMNRCITCYRCTRYYQNHAGGTDLAVMASHDHAYFGRHEDGVLQSEFSGNLVEVCPTGVFTDKTLVNDYTRKWDLQSAPSICTSCAAGCNTLAGERYGKIKRIHNRFNAEVNGYFLCDRGRFGASFVNSKQRLNQSGLRSSDGRYDIINHPDALQHLVEACQNKKTMAIGSPRSSVEANYLLRALVGSENFSPGFSTQEQVLVNHALILQQGSSALTPDIKTIESADAMLILGEDLTNTAPRLALALRQSVRNKSYALAAELRLEPWQDAAVRNLAQDQLSPLFIAAVADTRLDDVAEQTLQLAPNDIARLGSAIAATITGSTEGLTKQALDNDSKVHANNIARELMSAQRPLIISGTSCNNKAVMTAAADIANALSMRAEADNQTTGQAMLCLTVPEANSLGQAMLAGAQAPTLNTLYQRADAGDIDTLIIMENDLYRRDSVSLIDSLLEKVANIVVLDSHENATLSASSLALAAASFAESEGTLVSLEGRAQRYFPVFDSNKERKASWVWLLACLKELAHPIAADITHFDDITNACAAEIPALAAITTAAPDHLYRNAGLKIPRQTHRYSGRTAMRADISVHEPKQPVDDESALAFTMEGLNSLQPGSLLPYVWAPGWNSNQALHKFQSEVGGPLTGGTAGSRLLSSGINAPSSTTSVDIIAIPTAFTATAGQWQLVPRHKIFGSDELSAFSPAIAELIEQAFIEINSADAKDLQVEAGDGLDVGDSLATLEVHINDSVASGCAAYSIGFVGTFNLKTGDSVTLAKASQWQRQQKMPEKKDLIASDGGRHV